MKEFLSDVFEFICMCFWEIKITIKLAQIRRKLNKGFKNSTIKEEDFLKEFERRSRV